MLIFFTALTLSALVIGASLLFQVSQRRMRAVRFRGLELKPNCLLTRYPMAFISGPRTLFRLFDHWNDIPLYLREHGYEVFVIEPAGRTRLERTESVRVAVSQLETNCHLIADGSLEFELEELARMKMPHVTSLTVVKTRLRERFASREPTLSVNDLRPTATAVEIFEIESIEFPLRGFAHRMKLVLLGAHNFLIKRRTQFVHPLETAEFSSARPGFVIEQRFLDLAISLAERDVLQGLSQPQ